MELKQYLQIVWKWRWLIVLCTLLAAVVSYGVSSIMPPVYRASTSLLIRSEAVGGDDYGTIMVNQHLAATYTELMTKRPIVEAAGLNLGLAPSTITRLMTKVQIWVVPNTSVIRLTVEDTDPRLAAELANEIVSVFVQSQRDSGSGRGRNIYVAESASQPLEPVAPRKLLNMLVAAIGGCALAVGIAFLIEYLDDTLTTAEDINERLSLPMLAAIPHPNRQGQNQTLIAVADLGSSIAEAYRVLSTRIQFANGRGPLNGHSALRSILITSPVSRKEKANIAANLGIIMARAGLQVLLVDVDTQQPQLHQVFGLTNETGLSTFLAGDRAFDKCIAKTDISNLHVLSSGPPLEPSLWGSVQMVQRIQALKTQADVVLFDAPPVLAVTDVMVLASQVDATLLVIESRSTRQKVAMQAIERLQSVQAKMLGVVLNKVPDKQ
jgi:capsular exopolysaccharide synthesis family protein